MGSMSEALSQVLIPLAAFIGIAFALLQWFLVSKVRISTGNDHRIGDRLIEEDDQEVGIDSHEAVAKCAEIQNAISVGATSFLFTQYKYLGVFTVVFAVVIFLFLGSVNSFDTKSQTCIYNKGEQCKPPLANALFTTVAFLLGALTSVLSGFLEMKIATYANARTTLEARKGVDKAFVTAFRSGAAMGFLLDGNDLLVHYNSFNVFKLSYGDVWEGLYKSITGYVLGGSSVALFGKVGGEIYTKAADVEVEQNIPEESSKPSCDCR